MKMDEANVNNNRVHSVHKFSSKICQICFIETTKKLEYYCESCMDKEVKCEHCGELVSKKGGIGEMELYEGYGFFIICKKCYSVPL